MSKFLIDCGHTLSGGDTGAEGCGKLEQNLTREVGMKVISKYHFKTIVIEHIEIIIIKHIEKYIINHTRAIFSNIIITNKFIFKHNHRLIYN